MVSLIPPLIVWCGLCTGIPISLYRDLSHFNTASVTGSRDVQVHPEIIYLMTAKKSRKKYLFSHNLFPVRLKRDRAGFVGS